MSGWHRISSTPSSPQAPPPDDFAVDGRLGLPHVQLGAYAGGRRLPLVAPALRASGPLLPRLRIDHILGFFRIWEVPRTQRSGLLGHFHPALPYSLEEWQEKLALPFPVKLLTAPLVHEDELTARLG